MKRILITCIVAILLSELKVIAGNEDIVDIATKIFNDLSANIIKLSTAAALIGVGTGAFFKKLSFGKPDRIETGNKMIVNSIWGWVLINGLTAILSFFGGYLENQPEITWRNNLKTNSVDTLIPSENQQPQNVPTDLIIED